MQNQSGVVYNPRMLKLYNTLTRKIEDFKPIENGKVKMYSCGPTVYDFAHIGNFRTYTTADILVRTLQLNGDSVTWVMNITDVGHLVSDGDTGEDKMEKGARLTGKTAWEIADFYADVFLKDWKALHLTEPNERPRPTQHIPEQIALVQKLLDKGFAYQIDDGIYFDTSRSKGYGELAQLDLKNLQEGARVEINLQKRNPTDFALWKFSYPGGVTLEEYNRHSREGGNPENQKTGSPIKSGMTATEKRQMEWESPWGVGFPGWHIECSAMSMKYLGEHFDIHTGGVDILPVHHVNEVAQSEAATGKHPWINYWVHGQMMLIQGQKMSKSLKNIYRLYDLEKENFDPLALRYLYLQTHYRQEMNFTFPALEAAQNALNHLRESIVNLRVGESRAAEFEERFLISLNNDLNTPEALAILWELVKSDHAPDSKLNSIFRMDEVLGLGLEEYFNTHSMRLPLEVPDEITQLIKERKELRKHNHFDQADQIRNKIKKLGFDIEDSKSGTKIKKLS